MATTPADYMNERLQELHGAPNYRNWLCGLAAPWLGDSVLEVGAGLGTMTECFLDRPRVLALELEAEFAAHLKARLGHHRGLEVVVGDATDSVLMDRLATVPFASAVSYNVFEHIQDDVAAFRNVRAALAPGAHFVCFVPAGPAIYGPMDAHLGHFRRYRRRELAAKAQCAGFAVVRLHHVNLPGYFGWGFNSRILKTDSYAGGSRAVGIWDRFVIPAAQRIERRVRPPFGQSLLLVARKDS